MKTKTCIQCNGGFNDCSAYGRQSICSHSCRKERQFEKNREFQEKRRGQKNQSLFAACVVCQREFFKGYGRGKHKLSVCSLECKRAKASQDSMASVKRRKLQSGACVVATCRKAATRTGNTLCEAHYVMQRRRGTFDKKVYPVTADQGSYVRVLGSSAVGHPMCSERAGMLYEHRMVAYDSRNGVCEDCYWCGAHLTWKTCVIDHLNEDKHDNRPENLLIACARCNRARGAMLGFIARIKTEALPTFLQAVADYRRSHGTFTV